MERATSLFWLLVAVLVGTSVFYGWHAWNFKAASRSPDTVLASGDMVVLQSVIEADTLVVAKEGQGSTTVRVLGIRTFESKHGKDEAALHGRLAEEAVKQLVGAQPLRVLLNSPPKDRAGRTIAHLFADGEDIGLALVTRGHALVYPVYPFLGMQTYLQAQRAARQQRIGLWADPVVSEKADALVREWSRAVP